MRDGCAEMGINMTEREKMLAGQLYDCGDSELLNQWHKAKDLIRDYNQTDSADAQEKARILHELLGGQGKNLWITAPFYADYGNNIYFGNNCEVNMNCTFLDDNKIVIGDNALIAPNVQIYTAFHPTNAVDRFGKPREDGSFEFCKTQTAPVVIGDHVWIGGGVIIMPGVTIGDNVVIGAGSVVTRDIPDNVIAYGNPCRVMRENGQKSYEIIRLTDRPWLKGQAALWFHQKWGIPCDAYLESMEACLAGKGAVPQWYMAMEGDRIIGGVGVIENDFHNRKDLSPNVCAVYTEEDRRGRGVAGALLDYVCGDMKEKGIHTLYLLTDHTSFYERYGWEFYCMAQGDGEEKMSRMYLHRG